MGPPEAPPGTRREAIFGRSIAEASPGGNARRGRRGAPQKRRDVGAREKAVAARSQKSRQEGLREKAAAARPQRRPQVGAHEKAVAARSQKRRNEGARKKDVATSSQKRRTAPGKNPAAAARSLKRRLERAREPSVAERSQMRRREGTHAPNPKARTARRTGSAAADTEDPLRLLYGAGASYKKKPGKSAHASRPPNRARRNLARRAPDRGQGVGYRSLRQMPTPWERAGDSPRKQVIRSRKRGGVSP